MTSAEAARPADRLAVIGIGEDGWAGLGDTARAALRAAPTILGSARQLDLLPAEVRGAREPWPSPMMPRVDELVAALRDGADAGRWVVLASGDPMLHGVGATLVARGLPVGQLSVTPAPSAFSLACARLGWPSHETSLVSRVADAERPVAAELRLRGRVVVYVPGTGGARDLAADLRGAGLDATRFVVLERLGGPAERMVESTVALWDELADPLHLVALELDETTGRSASPLERLGSTVPGLPDDLFGGDGQLTRAEVRAVALAALAPRPGEVLWDVGAGSGTIAIEWCRAAVGTSAHAVEQRADRATTITANATALGAAPRVSVHVGEAPAALEGLPSPDAVFIGGGLTAGVLEQCWAALPVGGRLVANSVTLEGEAVLADAASTHGGRLVKLDIAHAEPIGRFTGWRPQRPITVWSTTKPHADAPLAAPLEQNATNP